MPMLLKPNAIYFADGKPTKEGLKYLEGSLFEIEEVQDELYLGDGIPVSESQYQRRQLFIWVQRLVDEFKELEYTDIGE